MLSMEIAKEIMDEAIRTGKSISAVSVERGYKAKYVHNAIYRLRKESGRSVPEEPTSTIRDIDHVLAEANDRRKRSVDAAHKDMVQRPNAIKDFARDLQQQLADEAEKLPAMSYALGYASGLIGLARDKALKGPVA